ncbi:hypothetical protein AB0D59_46605 [Streptomyces sp. NPDC048417]|uniref:hypothetical protein n=1 Tax=Streptomyces sp. NPDC048417 TaxID=3155387 RepID=UPI00344474F4
MSNSSQRPPLPLITVHHVAAVQAQHHVAGLLETAGASPAEVRRLIAVIQAGAVEAAHAEAIEQDVLAPPSSSDQFHAGWRGAVEAVTGRLTHIADRTVRQAQAATEPSRTLPPAPCRTPCRSTTMVDSVGEEQVLRVLEAAERIFVSLTGYTHYDHDLSEEILPVVLKAVGAEQQDGYVSRLETFAADKRERLAQLYALYGPGGRFEARDRCYLTHQPESLVVCERLDAAPLWLASVWNDEIDAELVLDRFTQYWRYGI